MSIVDKDVISREYNKSILDTDYTNVVKYVYSYLSNRYGYTARITDIFKLLKDSFGLDEFEILDLNLCNNGQFESYLIDELIKWRNKETINFSDIYRAILTVGDFTKRELDLFKTGDIEERLWAIFLVVYNPEIKELLN